MKKIVFDIETSNIFADVGKNDPALLNLSVICIYEYEKDTYTCYEQNELKNLWPILEKADVLIGFNSEHFDLPLLNKYYSGDLSKLHHVDILKEIKDSFGRRMKLDQIAEGTLGIKKSGNGLQAITWWKNGEYDKVKKYCKDDVKITKEIYDYAMKNKKIKFADGLNIVEVPLKTDAWEKVPQNSMTFSLPF